MTTAPGQRLIVHLGLPKTGTSSLQSFLLRNAAALQHRFAVFTPARGSKTRAMGRAAMEFSLDPSPIRKADLVAAIAAVKAEIAPDLPGCLISHENLPGAVPGHGATHFLYPHIEQILALLDEGFAPLRPEYVVYTRPMADWKASVHGQVVVSDGYREPLQTFLAETAWLADWSALTARLQTALEPDRFRLFKLEDEPELARPGQQLMRHAGLNADEIVSLAPVRRLKARLVPGALEFARLINGLDLPPRMRARLVSLAAQNQNLFNSQIVLAERA